jgi:predicted transcriptional regulator
MKEKALDSLQKDIEANVEKYQSASRWVDQYFIEKEVVMVDYLTAKEVMRANVITLADTDNLLKAINIFSRANKVSYIELNESYGY